jgi:hypothetical protein
VGGYRIDLPAVSRPDSEMMPRTPRLDVGTITFAACSCIRLQRLLQCPRANGYDHGWGTMTRHNRLDSALRESRLMTITVVSVLLFGAGVESIEAALV